MWQTLGLLNFVPASGIALASFLISLGRGELTNVSLAMMNILLMHKNFSCCENIVRNISSLDIKNTYAWSDSLKRITDIIQRKKNSILLDIHPDLTSGIGPSQCLLKQ
jgi:hypothetical protein